MILSMQKSWYQKIFLFFSFLLQNLFKNLKTARGVRRMQDLPSDALSVIRLFLITIYIYTVTMSVNTKMHDSHSTCLSLTLSQHAWECSQSTCNQSTRLRLTKMICNLDRIWTRIIEFWTMQTWTDSWRKNWRKNERSGVPLRCLASKNKWVFKEINFQVVYHQCLVVLMSLVSNLQNTIWWMLKKYRGCSTGNIKQTGCPSRRKDRPHSAASHL